MHNLHLIAPRLKHLRICHHLSIGQLADILGKTTSALSQIELGKTSISYELLLELADFFVVSLDWLTGRSNEPYSIDVIKESEASIQELESSISLSNNSNLIYLKAVVYFCHTKSIYFPVSEHYHIDRRADVLYCLNFWRYAANKLDEIGYNSQETSYQNALKQLMEIDDDEKHEVYNILKNYLIKTPIDIFSGSKSSKRAGSSFAKLCYECIDVLDDVITNPNSKKSYYDVRNLSDDSTR
ncbi:MAG: helix-turn-helix domain-containing protein [Schwartzia sp.]|uniref:helix-turn-helix domain-containing protein n=1 Tax=Schwartzia succinivorans TaxID=55507 RepID=UPI002357EFDC|nr:helix-turn-helix transcriptional regulator [Schwartzia succinivorans]MBE6098263.1 helix-turn-helix transcriptional regulator [Schwartzia succinivorans]MCR5447236.1 helix-turn-helix domain-containing protein [Schwartzia sp. (in: firmicutes)]